MMADDEAFPGPGLIQTNDQFGVYVIASRNLETGEDICEEYPLMIAPRLDWQYNSEVENSDKICLGCYKKCSCNKQCSRCGWPVCETICEKAQLHTSYECPIFSKYNVSCGNLNLDYPALETLRCLLLREKDPKKWSQLMKHESHVNRRQNDEKTKELREYVVNFIRDVCRLDQFDTEVIEHVMGIISINSFCMINDFHRHASLIFHSVSYVAHNCDPNMDVIWKFHPTDNSSYDQTYFSLKFFAARPIEAGELLSHSYMFNWNPVVERQNYLANYWYFHCECGKCRLDFFNELLNFEFLDDE